MQLSAHVLSPLAIRYPQHSSQHDPAYMRSPTKSCAPPRHAATLPNPETSDSPTCRAAHLGDSAAAKPAARLRHTSSLHVAYKGTWAAQKSHHSCTKAVLGSTAVTKQRRNPSTPENPAQRQHAHADVPTAARTRSAQRWRRMLCLYSTGRTGIQAGKVQRATQSSAAQAQYIAGMPPAKTGT